MKRLLLFALFVLPFTFPVSLHATPIFINEIHYDNSGADTGEGIEIAGLAASNLAGWSLVLYNGNGGGAYKTKLLGGFIPNEENGFGAISFSIAGIQNGAPDGVALVDASSTVIQFLSYEGAFTATNGVATGMTSIDIGVKESSGTLAGHSLQLTGTGSEYEDFAWSAPASNSFGDVNSGQGFTAVVSEPTTLLLLLSALLLLGLLKGRADGPERAKELYETAIAPARQEGVTVKSGEFQAHMEVELINDGPVTILDISSPTRVEGVR